MSPTRTFACLIFLWTALPGVGCAAAPACQPSISVGAGDCDICRETNCCAERHACDSDPACAGFLKCLRSSCASPPCFGKCGLPPQAYLDRFICQMAKCNTAVCGGPEDKCTACQSTSCGREFMICQNVEGCSTMAGCAASCRDDAECLEKCKGDRSVEALKASDAAQACYRNKCGQACS